MIRYICGTEYVNEGEEIALSPAEWRRLMRARRSIKVWGEDGKYLIIRKVVPADKWEEDE